MKKTILILVAVFSAAFAMAQVNIPYQTLRYDAHYHLGLINVKIATGTVTISTYQNNLKATLSGQSIPWEGRVFCISDTLYARMTPDNPQNMETVTYENGWYRKPKTHECQTGSFEYTNPANYKSIMGQGSLSSSPATMEAITVTADMLGLYYFFHQIDFDKIEPGQDITIPITRQDGQPEKVVINYQGKSQFNVGGINYPVYDLTFEYSYNCRMTGYPVKTYVGQYDRIPLYLSATLPVGRIEMIYAE